MIEKYLESGEVFCPYLFLHYHVDTDKSTKLCCHSNDSIKKELLPFDHEVFKILRNKMLNGEKLRYCTNCYQAESDGMQSLRQRTIEDVVQSKKIELLQQQIDLHLNNEKIQPYWYDLRISNNCNLNCQMCGPLYSSTWAKKLNQDNSHLGYEPDIPINPDTYKIQLAGGEPFMIKKFVTMLEKVTNTDCEIIVNTNGTILTSSLLDQLKKFNRVLIIVSIDGYRELNEKIRVGSNWREIDKNIVKLKEVGFDLAVNTVVQKDNVNYLYELGKYIESVGIDDWLLSRLFEPTQFVWSNEQNIDVEQLKRVLEFYSIKRNNSSVSLLNYIINSCQ